MRYDSFHHSEPSHQFLKRNRFPYGVRKALMKAHPYFSVFIGPLLLHLPLFRAMTVNRYWSGFMDDSTKEIPFPCYRLHMLFLCLWIGVLFIVMPEVSLGFRPAASLIPCLTSVCNLTKEILLILLIQSLANRIPSWSRWAALRCCLERCQIVQWPIQ